MLSRTRLPLFLVVIIVVAGCRQEGQDSGQLNASLAQCQAELASTQTAQRTAVTLAAERDGLKAALESVTRELVEVKVERDKMAVEIRAYQRRKPINKIQE